MSPKRASGLGIYVMELTDILRCPKTGDRLIFADGDSAVRVEGSDLTYPIIDGIINFLPEVADTVSSAYDTAASRYDAYITSSTLFMKLCNTIIWGISDDFTYADTLLSYLPSGFDGVLLDVPVGTGVFTGSVYAGFPDATIIAVDYSMEMLQKAARRFEQNGAKNVLLIRADVAALPVTDAAADIVLSMNGLHAFGEKGRAIEQMRRVLRKDGKLLACCYVKGAKRFSDFFVRHFGVRRGFFTPPFWRADEIASELDGFRITREESLKSIAWFEAVKTGP
jgi:ubiquinone/menaquinone biosynthesis C-methylase UbiE